jgi:hypothetical protein
MFITASELNAIEVSKPVPTEMEGSCTVGEADIGKEQVPYPFLQFFHPRLLSPFLPNSLPASILVSLISYYPAFDLSCPPSFLPSFLPTFLLLFVPLYHNHSLTHAPFVLLLILPLNSM